MWFNLPPAHPDWSKAIRHLKKADPVLRGIIPKVGPCTLHPRRDLFIVLCQSIFSQQISTRVAEVLFARFRALFPRSRPTPRRVREALMGDETFIAGCGLSRQKKAYLLDLSHHFEQRLVPWRKFSRMTDEEVIASLTQVKGIGRWTAEMLLMFTLNRPDVLPVDDLGLRKGMQQAYRLGDLPKAAEMVKLADSWRPWRSIGTWYMWRQFD